MMGFWSDLGAALAGPFEPPFARGPLTAGDRARGPSADALGLFPIAVADLAAARAFGVEPELLALLFPRTAQFALSRGRAYYDVGRTLAAVPSLLSGCRKVEALRYEFPALHFALFENLFNVVVTSAFTCWAGAIEQQAEEPRLRALLGRLLTAGVRLADVLLQGAPGAQALETTASACRLMDTVPIGGSHRVFRELDNPWKIREEISFLADEVLLSRPEVSTLLIPLYGSFAFGLAAQSVLSEHSERQPFQVHHIRLGFHDLGHIDFVSGDGQVDLSLLTPQPWRDELSLRVAGQHVLVVDDNVGYGSTLRACRTVIGQLGGRSTTRSVETAWHLRERMTEHQVAVAVDLPSLRPNFHHRLQCRLIDHLIRDDVPSYVTDPAHSWNSSLVEQMEANLAAAAEVGGWSAEQLAQMEVELRHARRHWASPAIPELAWAAAA